MRFFPILLLIAGTVCSAQADRDPFQEPPDPTWSGLYQLQETLTPPRARFLTAFRVAGQNGLFTCLHGVLEAALDPHTSLTARNTASTPPFTIRMKVHAVDPTHDLAFLVPLPEDAAQWQERTVALHPHQFLPATAETVIKASQQISIEGYPGSSGGVLVRAGAIESGQRHLLSQLVDQGAVTTYLTRRDSPRITYHILPLAMQANAGESGSPVLLDGTVIGIIDGKAHDNEIWAIPADIDSLNANGSRFHSLEEPGIRQQLEGIATVERQNEKTTRETLTAFDGILSLDACDRAGKGEAEALPLCLAQSLRFYKKGRLSLVPGAKEQFYFWLDLPTSLQSRLGKTLYRIPTVTDHGSGFNRKPGDSPLNACTLYKGSGYFDPRRAVVPWKGGNWQQTITVSLSTTFDGHPVQIENVPFDQIRFDQPPPESLRKPDTKDCSK